MTLIILSVLASLMLRHLLCAFVYKKDFPINTEKTLPVTLLTLLFTAFGACLPAVIHLHGAFYGFAVIILGGAAFCIAFFGLKSRLAGFIPTATINAAIAVFLTDFALKSPETISNSYILYRAFFVCICSVGAYLAYVSLLCALSFLRKKGIIKAAVPLLITAALTVFALFGLNF